MLLSRFYSVYNESSTSMKIFVEANLSKFDLNWIHKFALEKFKTGLIISSNKVYAMLSISQI